MPLKAPRWIYGEDWGGYFPPYITAEELWPWVVLSSPYPQPCGIHLWTVWFSFTWHINLHLNSFELLLLLLPRSPPFVTLGQSCVELMLLLSPTSCLPRPFSREGTGLKCTFRLRLCPTVWSCKEMAWASCMLTSTANVAQRSFFAK